MKSYILPTVCFKIFTLMVRNREKIKANLQIVRKDIQSQYFKSYMNESSHQKCSVKKGVLRNFAKFTPF